MVMQETPDAGLLTRIPVIEDVLSDHASQLGRDFTAYRNHVYRVANLCLAISGHNAVDREKIAIAAVFHDLGIWTDDTFDYIPPSVAVAREYLTRREMADWIPEVAAMIMHHHKVTATHTNPPSLVESFRRADWIDVTRGLRTFGLPRSFVATVIANWPNAGFHRRLVQLTVDRFKSHPLTPLPMLEW